MNSEEIIVALAVKYNGDWESIMCALDEKEREERNFIELGLDWAEINGLDKYLKIVESSNYKYVTILSDQYPPLLKQQYMPPFVLFYYGDISLLSQVSRNVAVVGSRECSEYGEEMTKLIVKDICEDFTVVSGLAIGIDTVAQQTAIDNGGRTIAVLGGGIDYCYPVRNYALYKEIKENHLVISEYPGVLVPQMINFPRRNRIIAMISCGTIVTEAYAKSGTLTTVMFTLQANRLLLCVPYPAGKNSECNRLIASGAYLIENGKQALEILKHDIHL